MRKSLLLLTWLLIGCGATANRARASFPITTALSREVTAVATFTYDLPMRYQRLHDAPGRTFALWSGERLCLVDQAKWIRTIVGDRVTCEWRSPR